MRSGASPLPQPSRQPPVHAATWNGGVPPCGHFLCRRPHRNRHPSSTARTNKSGYTKCNATCLNLVVVVVVVVWWLWLFLTLIDEAGHVSLSTQLHDLFGNASPQSPTTVGHRGPQKIITLRAGTQLRRVVRKMAQIAAKRNDRRQSDWPSGSESPFTWKILEILPKASEDCRKQKKYLPKQRLVEIMCKFRCESASSLSTSENGATRPASDCTRETWGTSRSCSSKRC